MFSTTCNKPPSSLKIPSRFFPFRREISLNLSSSYKTANEEEIVLKNIEKYIQQHSLYLEMNKIYKENKNDNWDGYGAIGINNKQLEYANNFMNKIFNSNLSEKILKFIEINPENYGNIAFDWFVNHDRQISISIRDNKAIFTYKFDKRKIYGEIPLNEDLTTVIDLIQKLYE